MYIKSHNDFETRSKVLRLDKVGAFRYAQDPSTEAMFFCWSYGDSDEIHRWFFKDPYTKLEELKELGRAIEKGVLFYAHNAEFEYAIWNYAFVPQIKRLTGVTLPKLKVEQLRCTAAKAAYLCLPRKLEHLALALDTPTKKDMGGNAKMKKLMKPRKPTKNNKSLWHEDPEDFEAVGSYCEDDVEVEKQCDAMLFDLPKREWDIYHLTVIINERGMKVDLPLIRKAIVIKNKFEKELQAELLELTEGRVHSVNQHAKMKAEIHGCGYQIPNMQAETVEVHLKEKILSKKVRRLLEIKLMLGKSSLAKLDTMLMAACEDGRVRGTQLYYGATTGRWAGRGMQPHNFKKSSDPSIPNYLELLRIGDYELYKSIYPNVYETLSNSLRHLIIADTGKDFIDVDWNAIEARIVLWLAGDEDGLEVYRQGLDAYKVFAGEVLEKDYIDVTKDERQYIGKPGVLGCGFGMGFRGLAAQYDLEEKLAFKIVNRYRKVHRQVKLFWGYLNTAACDAVLNPGRVFTAGKLIAFKYDKKNRFLKCLLPSGRMLFYQKPRIKKTIKKIKYEVLKTLANGDEVFETKEKKIRQNELHIIVYKGSRGFPNSVHGSHLCENVTQAVARDIVAEAMLRLDGTEYEQTLSLHDEIKCEMNRGEDEEKFLTIVNQPCTWAKGLPLKTEHWVGKRFRS